METLAMPLGFGLRSHCAMKPTQPRQDVTGLVKRVWLLLYSEGGWWSAAEIRSRLHVDKSLQAMQSALGEMARHGFITRQRSETIDGEARVQYGVIRKCKVPRGVVIEEIEQLLLQIALQGRRQ